MGRLEHFTQESLKVIIVFSFVCSQNCDLFLCTCMKLRIFSCLGTKCSCKKLLRMEQVNEGRVICILSFIQ